MLRKTYITSMPDKAGAFLIASRNIASCGGNIVRVNYNKAVDTHTLFIEVSATPSQHIEIEKVLVACGYIANEEPDAQMLMISLTLQDVPGAVTPVLEILDQHRVNISYMSSQENGTSYQHFKMGLLIENTKEIVHLINQISKICEIRILNYQVTERLLDGTVFYISFANAIREILSLSQDETNAVLIHSNRLMQLLDEQNKSPLQTFDYIRRFAQFVHDKKGTHFCPKIQTLELNSETRMIVVEPPCGSNTYIMEYGNELLFVDCGFACYRDEMDNLFMQLFPRYKEMKKTAFITHPDVDHTGLLPLFDKIYMSQNCYDNFVNESNGVSNFREQNPLHAPYCALSKIISEYRPPDLTRCIPIGSKQDESVLSYIGSQSFGPWSFHFYEGKGGHIKGETVIVWEEMKAVFCGDIYVNIKGFSEEQSEFNRLAPFLMTGVDSDSTEAKRCRQYLLKKYPEYLLCSGHGSVVKNTVGG